MSVLVKIQINILTYTECFHMSAEIFHMRVQTRITDKTVIINLDNRYILFFSLSLSLSHRNSLRVCNVYGLRKENYVSTNSLHTRAFCVVWKRNDTSFATVYRAVSQRLSLPFY
jgi:hypothetical protein